MIVVFYLGGNLMSLIKSVSVNKVVQVQPKLEIEIRGNRPHIGKSKVMELIRRTLIANGYGQLVNISQDRDSLHWASRHNAELVCDDSDLTVVLVDNNGKI